MLYVYGFYFQVSSLYQRSVVIIVILMKAKAGCAEMRLK